MCTIKSNTKIMAIVNVTPDSFSGDGMLIDTAIQHALYQIQQGADILDIGGESTRPEAKCVDAETEKSRILPVIKGIRAIHPHITISIDTYKAEVADCALQNGANMINDVWGGTQDPHMFAVAKKHACPICLMHNKTTVGAIRKTHTGTAYMAEHMDNYMDSLLNDMRALANDAIQNGIPPEQIILDPGLAFGKTVQQNLQIIKHVPDIQKLGYPLLLGASRKSFIGEVLHTQVADRTIGTCAINALATGYGVDIIRVHDVHQNLHAVQMVQAIQGA